jgi:hypothetical protein
MKRNRTAQSPEELRERRGPLAPCPIAKVFGSHCCPATSGTAAKRSPRTTVFIAQQHSSCFQWGLFNCETEAQETINKKTLNKDTKKKETRRKLKENSFAVGTANRSWRKTRSFLPTEKQGKGGAFLYFLLLFEGLCESVFLYFFFGPWCQSFPNFNS